MGQKQKRGYLKSAVGRGQKEREVPNTSFGSLYVLENSLNMVRVCTSLFLLVSVFLIYLCKTPLVLWRLGMLKGVCDVIFRAILTHLK